VVAGEFQVRYGRVKKALRKMGITVRERKGKGSHVLINDGSGRAYTLPCHHGQKTVLSDHYLKAVCRFYELDYDEFRKLL
jgi:predicted RNA binding protein YcfA (HicA-like mRNA interferase family)